MLLEKTSHNQKAQHKLYFSSGIFILIMKFLVERYNDVFFLAYISCNKYEEVQKDEYLMISRFCLNYFKLSKMLVLVEIKNLIIIIDRQKFA